MSAITFEIAESPDPEDVSTVIHNLTTFNAAVAVAEDPRPLAVFARSGEELCGGISGITHWGWLHIKHLWVREDTRRAGVGSQLMVDMENTARARGCIAAHLDTFSFQALPFYLALGYRHFGTLDSYPPGEARHFLWRPLHAST